MANTIKIKNSGTASAVPASLEYGELGLNYADGKVYYKNSSNAIVALPSKVTVSDTAPSSPSAGSVWYESDTGKMFVYHDSFWVEASGSDGATGATGITGATGATGATGIAIQNTAPSSTTILWADTSVTGVGVVPVGGTTGQVLSKGSNTSYDAVWANAITSSDLALKANIASPTFTGTVTIPTGASISGFAPLASPTFTGNVSGISATMVGLGNVTNTSDANKPVSTAQQTALDLKAPLASPTFTGTATFPNVTIDGASGTISSQGVGNFKTIAGNGRGVGISGGTGDTPAILQFTNHAVNAQWGFISASSAGELTISGRILNTSVNIATGTPFVTTVNTTASTNIATVSLTVKGGRPILVMASGDANPSSVNDAWNYLQLFRGETGIGSYVIQQTSGASNNQAFGIVALDPAPSAGTYTYSLRAWNGSGPLTYGETGAAQGPVIIALELL
jgi:hypothetical protein